MSILRTACDYGFMYLLRSTTHSLNKAVVRLRRAARAPPRRSRLPSFKPFDGGPNTSPVCSKTGACVCVQCTAITLALRHARPRCRPCASSWARRGVAPRRGKTSLGCVSGGARGKHCHRVAYRGHRALAAQLNGSSNHRRRFYSYLHRFAITHALTEADKQPGPVTL